jgi:hypothetical protein
MVQNSVTIFWLIGFNVNYDLKMRLSLLQKYFAKVTVDAVKTVFFLAVGRPK